MIDLRIEVETNYVERETKDGERCAKQVKTRWLDNQTVKKKRKSSCFSIKD